MMGGKTLRGAALAMLPALCLALCLAAPSAALASQTSAADVTIVASGSWPSQETSTVDVRQQSAPLSQTSDATASALMAALAGTAASSLALIACLARRDS